MLFKSLAICATSNVARGFSEALVYSVKNSFASASLSLAAKVLANLKKSPAANFPFSNSA